jgi:hypothetical protein
MAGRGQNFPVSLKKSLIRETSPSDSFVGPVDGDLIVLGNGVHNREGELGILAEKNLEELEYLLLSDQGLSLREEEASIFFQETRHSLQALSAEEFKKLSHLTTEIFHAPYSRLSGNSASAAIEVDFFQQPGEPAVSD